MPRIGPFRVVAPVSVLVALALVSLLAYATQSGSAPAVMQGTQTATVTSVTRACPPAAPNAGKSQISMVALPAHGAAMTGTATLSEVPEAPAAHAAPAATPSASGSATAGTASATASPAATSSATAKPATKVAQPVSVTDANAVTTLAAPGGAGAAVEASGQMAEGFEAEQTDASGAGLVSCTHPGSDMWFVGTGAAAGASKIELYLMNTGNVAASVTLTILTDTGMVNGPGTAVTVAPDQSVTENLAQYVQGSEAVAIHVQAGTGQVSAAVWEGGSGGSAWLPQANAPATSLVIPGLTVASSAQRLFVVVPGQAGAQLKIEAYTPAGKSVQFPDAPVEATATAATPVTLSGLGASAAGLELKSNVPIVAGVQVPGAGIGSFTTAVPPVTGQGVVTGNPATRGVTVGLLLTAPEAAAKASISVVTASGAVAATQTVTVTAAHTLAVPVTRPASAAGKPFAVVITPAAGSGPLYAARAVTTGTSGISAPLAALLPVVSALTSIQLPPTANSYDAVIP